MNTWDPETIKTALLKREISDMQAVHHLESFYGGIEDCWPIVSGWRREDIEYQKRAKYKKENPPIPPEEYIPLK